MKLNFKEKKQQNKGITLIALIITIIVLLILAVVAIREVQGDGIISKAKKAKTKTEQAQAEEEQRLLELEYQIASAQGTVTGTFTDYVLETKYNGLKIGDYVAYNEAGFGDYTAETSKGAGRSVTWNSTTKEYDLTAGDAYKTNDDDLNWRVLGVNAKGELELISDNPTTNSLFLANEEGYLNAGTVGDKKGTLDTFCNTLYGNGKGSTGKVVASGARSLNIDDIDKLAGITTEEQKKKMFSSQEYGVELQYRYPTRDEAMKTDENVSPKGKDDTLYMQKKKATDTKWTDITEDSYQKFRLPGESETIGKISDTEIKEGSRSVKYTYYYYTISNYVKQVASDGKSMADIITNGTGTSNIPQWLASPYVDYSNVDAGFGLRYVAGGGVYRNGLFYSDGGWDHRSSRVRPVVSLKSDIQIDTNAKDGKTPSTAYEIK